MIDKNKKEGEHTQGIEMKGHKISQIVPHNMILHEKHMDRKSHLDGTIDMLKLICVTNQPFKHTLSFSHTLRMKTPIVQKSTSFIIHTIINNT